MSGSLTHSPADVIRNLIIDLGDGTAPSDGSDWPVFVGQEPNDPDSVITVYNTAGVIEGKTSVGARVEEHHGVQIRVRDANPHQCHEKARAIAVSLDAATLRVVEVGDVAGTGNDTYLVMDVMRTSGPLSLGKDVTTSKLNVFTINFKAAMQQTS